MVSWRCEYAILSRIIYSMSFLSPVDRGNFHRAVFGVDFFDYGGVYERAVNNSTSGSGGPGFKPRPSRCFLRQGTYLNFVFTQVYEWVPATNWRWTSIPSMGEGGGGVGGTILLGMLHAKETGISSSRLGFWLVFAFTFFFTLLLHVTNLNWIRGYYTG